MPTWTSAWLADGLLCVLLIATLVMSIRLDRALRLVRRDRSAFEALIGSLGSATQAVSDGVQRLRSEAQSAAELVERRAEEADRLATDLSFLIERAERVGNHLEPLVRRPAATARPCDAETDVDGHDSAAIARTA